MELDKKLIVAVMLITAFIFGVSFSTLYAQTHIVKGTACTCLLPVPLLLPTFSSLGLFIGSLVYYLLLPKIEESKDKKIESFKSFLNLLNHDERTVLSKILDNGGKVTQSRISADLGKVRAFRTIQNLIKRGILEKEPYGKTNLIKLSERMRNILDI